MGSWAVLMLLWARASTLLLAARPVFGQPGVPPQVRLGLGMLLAWMVWPAAASPVWPGGGAPPAAGGPGWAVWGAALAQEVVVGLVMAFAINTLFGAVILAGQLIDLPMGFSVVNVIDPMLEQQTPLIGQFHTVLAVLIFFGVDGHHMLLRALADSAQWLPPGAMVASGALLQHAVGVFAAAFALGLRFGAPVMAALFLADAALAVVARAVPQLNIFVVGFPVKILLGFGALLLTLPAFVQMISGTFGQGGGGWEWVLRLISALSGR